MWKKSKLIFNCYTKLVQIDAVHSTSFFFSSFSLFNVKFYFHRIRNTMAPSNKISILNIFFNDHRQINEVQCGGY